MHGSSFSYLSQAVPLHTPKATHTHFQTVFTPQRNQLPLIDQYGPAAVPEQTAAEMAEHSFYEYQRLVQKEAEPELIIQLPNRGDDLEEADMRPPMIESEDASLQTPMNLVVTVAFAVAQPSCGLQFCDRYACTDNQVDSTRNVWQQGLLMTFVCFLQPVRSLLAPGEPWHACT